MIKRILSLILFVCIGVSSFGTNYYLSNLGNDSNSGTSPSEAWQTITQLNTISLSPGDSVLFECGSIFRGEIDLMFSGTQDSFIYFGQYGNGALPIISGAKEATGWSLYDGNIYQAPFTNNVTQLFADDKLMTIARFPNHGYLFQKGAISDTAFADSSLTEGTNYWKGATVRMRMNDRAWEIRTVDSSASGEIYLQTPFLFPILYGYGYYMDNLFSLLDTTSEWYYSSTGEIFFYSPLGTDPSSLEVEASEYFYGLKIIGSVSFIQIENIYFEKQQLAGIQLSDSSSNISIENCLFEQQGQVGIEMNSGGTSVTILKNTFNSIQSIGIRGVSVDSISISQNSFKNIGLLPGYGVYDELNGFPVVLDVSEFVEVSKNEMDSSGNGGISLTGNNCLVERNVIRNSFLIANNSGAILNSNSLNHDNVISDNFIYSPLGNNEATPGNLIYSNGISLSDTCVGCRIFHNTIIEASGDGILLDARSAFYSIENNLIFGCKESQMKIVDGVVSNSTTGNEVRRNVFYAISEDQDVVQLHSKFLAFSPAAFDTNYYFNPYDYYSFDRNLEDSVTYDFRYTLQQWQSETAEDQNSKSTFFNRDRFSPIDSLGPELITNGHFTNNLDEWSIAIPGNVTALLDNSTPLDNGCLKIIKTDSLPFQEGVVYSTSFSIDSGEFYKFSMSNFSIKEGNVRFHITLPDTVLFPKPMNRYFPSSISRQNYSTVFQALGTSEKAVLDVIISYRDSIAWVDNISIAKVTAQYHDPHLLSRLFLNPTNASIQFDLGDSIFFDLDQNIVTGVISLAPYSSTVLIYDSSMILGTKELPAVNSSITVYPNPVLRGSSVMFRIPEDADHDLHLTMLDASGRILFEHDLKSASSIFSTGIPQDISEGIYLLHLTSGNKMWYAKLIVE